MKSLSEFPVVLIHSGFVDFRKGIFGLSAYVQSVMSENPFAETHLFVFCNRHRTAIKILYWDASGFALWQKVLDKEKFQWPKRFGEKMIITSEQLLWLLQGIDIFKLKPHKKFFFSRAV